MSELSEADQNRKIAQLEAAIRQGAKMLEAYGVIPDDDMMIPTELREPVYPVKHIDRANNPPYIIAGELVEWKYGHWYSVNCPTPPFNPYWGLHGHPSEKIGIDLYDPIKHDVFLEYATDDGGNVWAAEDRAARAAAVKAASPIPNENGWSDREVI